jgi:chemotaxis-related protein WspB
MLALTFSVGEGRYAVDVRSVVEVVPRIGLRPVPHAPSCVVGVFDHGGTIVPVVDLGILLGSGPCATRLGTRIILTQDGPGGLLGLIAECATELRETPDEAGPPSVAEGPEASFLGPFVRVEDGLIQVLRVEPIGALATRRDGEARGAP